MRDSAEYLEFETVSSLGPATLTLEISAIDVELALASNGATLRPALMAALYAALTVQSAEGSP